MKMKCMMISLSLVGILKAAQHTRTQIVPQNLSPRKLLIEFVALHDIALHNNGKKLVKTNHAPVIMYSRSVSPVDIQIEVQNQLSQRFSISPTHQLELLDQDSMNKQDAETYFTKPTGHLHAPSNSPLCLMAIEHGTPQPVSPLDLQQ